MEETVSDGQVPAPIRAAINRAARCRYAVVFGVAALFAALHTRGAGKDWAYLLLGNKALLGQLHLAPGGLHVYASYPIVQVGPLALLALTPFRLFGDGGSRIAATVAMALTGPLLVYVLERTARDTTRPTRGPSDTDWVGFTVLVGGSAAMVMWSAVAALDVHPDDVLVLAFCCLALWAVALGRPWLLGACVGLAIATKPWGVLIVPLLLAVPGRSRVRAASLAGGIACAFWLPFFVAAPGTLHALRPQLDTSPASVLHLFGVGLRRLPPGWVRPVQFSVELAVGTIAVLRRRWAAVVLAGIAARLLLDPGVFPYYSSGLLLAALGWDLVRSESPLPLYTLGTFWMIGLAGAEALPHKVQAITRLLTMIGVIFTVLLPDSGTDQKPPGGSEK